MNVDPLILILSAIIGCIAGSFASCIGSRLFNDEVTIFSSLKSMCLNCKHQLHIRDLLPIISFIMLKGRCRYCHTKLQNYNILSEIILFLLFPIIVCKSNGINILSAATCILATLLMIQAISDIRTMMASDVVSILICITCITIARGHSMPYILILSKSLLALTGCLLLRYLMLLFIKKDALGLGDVKLFTPLYMLLSIDKIPFFLAIMGFSGVLYSRWVIKKGTFPFVPSISVAFFISLYTSCDLFLIK